MKQGWEIKRLEEVAIKLFAGGDKPKIFSEHPTEDLNIPIYANGVSLDGLVGYTDKAVVDKESITISARGTIGYCCVRKTPFVPIVRLITIIPTEYIKTEFLYYALSNATIENNGVAIPQLTIPMIKGIPIHVPPREEQERIVEELDCLSGVIEKKREQLKELDALAESIFYTMFGDPITNEKGWETCELQKVSTLLNGRAYKQNELLDEGKYKVLRVGNFFTNSNYYYSDLELEPEKYCDDGDLLFAWSASFGAFIWNGGKVIYHYHIWKVLYDKQKLNIDYYRFLLNTMTAYFMKDVHGIGMVHLTKAGMEQYILPIPPLTLQQEFADKIEAIEKQKELIKKSISETETLFNARMDYYFN